MFFGDSRTIFWGALMLISLSITGCNQNEDSSSTTTTTSSSSSSSSSAKRESEPTAIETVLVSSKNLERTVRIPAELAAFRMVEIYPKVQGFVKTMSVDRGSQVKKGQILVEIVAPELDANYLEAEAKYEAVRTSLFETEAKIASLIAQKEEAEARLEADEANLKRIQIAAKTVGAVAPVDLETIEMKVQGDKARVRSAEQTIAATQSALAAEKSRVKGVEQALCSVREMKGYLTVRAPFDGVISERNVHEGSLVSSSASSPPMLKVEQISVLRLLVPVPENAIAGVRNGSAMKFTVSSFVGKQFHGKISRVSHELDRKTRTMIVELDVPNPAKELEPGMYAEVIWHMKRQYQTLFVPASSILSREDKTYLVRIKGQKSELVPISRGQPMGKLVEIAGDIKEGDQVALYPSEELMTGSVNSHLLSNNELESRLAEHGKED